MAGDRPDSGAEPDTSPIDTESGLFMSVTTDPHVVARKRQKLAASLADSPADRHTVLARAINALVEAGFGFNSAPVAGVVSMQRAWQGPGEDLVVVDAVTLDTQGWGLAVREGVSGRPVWGPERGEWSVVVAAVLSQPAPQGYARVAARERPVSEVDEPVSGGPGVIEESILEHGRPLLEGSSGEEVLDAG